MGVCVCVNVFFPTSSSNFQHKPYLVTVVSVDWPSGNSCNCLLRQARHTSIGKLSLLLLINNVRQKEKKRGKIRITSKGITSKEQRRKGETILKKRLPSINKAVYIIGNFNIDRVDV